MTNQDQKIIKNLLQYMAAKHLTGSDEFRDAIKHFNVTVVSGLPPRSEGFLSEQQVYEMDVFTPETIDTHKYGVREKFNSKEERDLAIANMNCECVLSQ